MHRLLPLKSRAAVACSGTLLICIAFSSGGCAFLNPGSTGSIVPKSSGQRVGQVCILRGLIGIWSLGLDGLGAKINAQGIHTVVFQDDQWPVLAMTLAKRYRNDPNPEPLVIIGHSYGADNALRITYNLNSYGIKVDLLITIDPVTPPHVPPNVKVALDYYETRGVTDNLPWWRGIPLKACSNFKGTLINNNLAGNRRDLRYGDTGHSGIEKDIKIHAEILQWLLKICLPRDQWQAACPAPAVRDRLFLCAAGRFPHEQTAQVFPDFGGRLLKFR